MCGIAAVLTSNRQGPPLEDVLSGIAHRGEPGCSRVAAVPPDSGASLGINRLPIVGGAAGRQPTASPSGRYLLVFNGEVFNFRSLLQELRAVGARLPAARECDSDTTVLAAAVERWTPTGAVDRLVWEGAFLCADRDTGELWAVRDHLGIKPLYWTQTKDGYTWASEIKALIPYTTGSVHPLPPGSLAHMPTSGWARPEVRTWWDAGDHLAADGDTALARPEQLTDQLEALLRESVRLRVPRGRYAVALSGGVDSALVLRLAYEYNDQVTAYLLHAPDSPDEPYAHALCERLGVPLVAVPAAGPDQLRQVLPEVVRTVESWEWQVVNHAAPMMVLNEQIRADRHRVLLTGEGADELFFGYQDPAAAPRPAAELVAERLRRVTDLHRTNCRRLDRMTMRSTLECRVPFLDRALTEFALGLPPGLALRDSANKWLLRQVAARLLEPRFAFRRKLSFARGVGYRYGGDGPPSVFGGGEPAVELPPEWAGLARYAVERTYLGLFLADGYGKASYLRRRSQ
ncbi:asparagine synthetase B family protein [Streptomyces sp. NPDC058252]|uniref:asparagine synthetase B family protein n=1 Tax=Streptomyces sp. NPDC058252 TaxID=3346405 RepID=UPI0036F1373E